MVGSYAFLSLDETVHDTADADIQLGGALDAGSRPSKQILKTLRERFFQPWCWRALVELVLDRDASLLPPYSELLVLVSA